MKEIRTLNPEYREVNFLCAESDPPAHFFIVTAHNPDGVPTEDSINAVADASLRMEIERRGFLSFSVTGGSPDFSHAEAGYGIQCTRMEALSLARQFRQDAIFEVRHGQVILISALPSSEPDESIGDWENLWIK